MEKDAASEELLARQRLLVALSGFALMAVLTIVSALLPFSNWRTAGFTTWLALALTIGAAIRYRDPHLGHLLVFGLAMGICELPGDAYLVDISKTLDFSVDGGGPRVLRSPIYMPFAWQLMAVQFAIIGSALRARWGLLGIALTGLLGGVAIPIFDEFARSAHWWVYMNCRMAHNVPYYMITSLALITMCMAYTAPFLQSPNRPWLRAVVAGALNGFAALLAYFLTYTLLG